MFSAYFHLRSSNPLHVRIMVQPFLCLLSSIGYSRTLPYQRPPHARFRSRQAVWTPLAGVLFSGVQFRGVTPPPQYFLKVGPKIIVDSKKLMIKQSSNANFLLKYIINLQSSTRNQCSNHGKGSLQLKILKFLSRENSTRPSIKQHIKSVPESRTTLFLDLRPYLVFLVVSQDCNYRLWSHQEFGTMIKGRKIFERRIGFGFDNADLGPNNYDIPLNLIQ